MFRVALSVMVIGGLLGAAPVSNARDWAKELLQDVVKVGGGKMTLTEFGLLDIRQGPRPRRLQVKWYAEAPSKGVVSRDAFVQLTAALQTTVFFSLAAGGNRVALEDLGEAFEFTSLDALIGNPDLTVSIFVSKDGFQVEYAGETVSRLTKTWGEIFDKKTPRPAEAQSPLPPTCLKYLETAKACFAQAGESARSAQGAFDQVAKSWEDVARSGGGSALESGCKQAWAQARQSFGSMCPNISWR